MDEENVYTPFATLIILYEFFILSLLILLSSLLYLLYPFKFSLYFLIPSELSSFLSFKNFIWIYF